MKLSWARFLLVALLPWSAGAQPLPPQPPVPPKPAGVTALPPEGRAYTPGAFDSIEISGAATVRLAQGAADQVFIEGDDEVQRSVSMEVRDGLLVVRPAGNWKFWNTRRVALSITARDIKRVVISGAADLIAAEPMQLGRLAVSISGAGLARFDQLKAEQLSFHVSGAGDGQVAGVVNELLVIVAGRSEFRGENLMCQQATVKISGIADVKVWVTQELGIAVSGVGTVDYWGSPQVRRRTTGIANINERGPRHAVP